MLGEWGVKDSKGNWLEFRVSEKRALTVFMTNKDSAGLYSNVDPHDLSKAVCERTKSSELRAA